MKKLTTALVALCAALVLAAPLAYGQVSGSVQAQTPLTRDIGSLKTLTAQGPATVTTSDQNGFNVSRVSCVYRQSAHASSPSVTFKIQNKDAASGQYYDLLTSAAIVTESTNALHVGAGLPNVTNSSAGLPIAKTWRVSLTSVGTATTITGTIGCSVQ